MELKRRAPGGRIRLSFADEHALARAAALFDSAQRAADGHSLTLLSDGSVSSLRQVLDRLEHADVGVDQVAAEPPGLDDVFFALTGGDRCPEQQSLEVTR